MSVVPIRRVLTVRVLVVDSQGDIGNLLAMAGYDAEVTGDASDALRRLAQARYDLVISDLGKWSGGGQTNTRGSSLSRPPWTSPTMRSSSAWHTSRSS